MHGTGTPLGDPIEIGAATAVLGSTNRPLQLSAAKSLTGHGEPAAGMAGIVQASAMLTHVHASQLPHLRNLNPHIVSLVSEEGKSAANVVGMPRQPSGRVAAVETARNLGCSAFAFQGTNAHVVLQPATATIDYLDHDVKVPAWQRQRFWFAPESRVMLHKAVGKGTEQIGFQTSLSRSAMAFFMDHRIQGAALFPGAGMFDMACSAGAALNVGHSKPALLRATIAAPLVMERAATILLSCTITCVAGRVDILSQTGNARPARLHLRASYGEQPLTTRT